VEIRDRHLRNANLGKVEGAEGDDELEDPTKIEFDKNVDVRLLLKSKAVRDGDLRLFDQATLLKDEECVEILETV